MKRLLSIMTMASLLMVAGCHPDPFLPDPFLTVSPTDLSFGQDGGSQTVKVTANYPWTASASGAGVTVSPASGEGDGTVTITVAAANSTSDMRGSVSFSSEGLSASVSVKQDAKTAIIVGNVSQIPVEGGTFKVDIQYNTDYTVEIEKSAQSWITFNGTKAMQSGKLEFTFAANEGDERTGKVTVTDKSGKVAPITLTFVQEKYVESEEDRIKDALMQIYDAMDGPNWGIENKWDLSKDLNSWEGVHWNPVSKELELRLVNTFKLKGEFPDCFDKLTSCVFFVLSNQPGVTGTLPPSFSKLNRLGYLCIFDTAMTGLPDLFADMPLYSTTVSRNELMTGQIPESLGLSDGYLQGKGDLHFGGNGFTGNLPESWLRLGTRLNLQNHRLAGQLPDYFYSSENAAYIINMYLNEGNPDDGYRETHPFFVKDYDIPGYWPDKEIKDVITGKPIQYDEIIAKNKVTVVFKWASWCGYSAALLPQLKKMYEKYHDDGLEIIARPGWGDEEGVRNLVSFLSDKGYDKWYNLSSDDLSLDEAMAMGEHGTPFANVIDNNGNIIFSSARNVSDPARERFNKIAFNDLIPFLEDIFGPMEDEDDYSSSDYSQDGKVITLQKASVGKGINLVFLGDAYTDKDFASNLYGATMQSAMSEFFSIEPYKTFRDRFNVYSVVAVSKNGRTGPGYSTAFGTVVQGNSITVSAAGEEKCFEYALKVPDIKDKNNLLICVLVNSSGRRGITSMSESLQSGVAYLSSVSNDPSLFGPILRHEAGGHGFAFLADEYFSANGSPSAEVVKEYNRLYNAYGWYSNVDFTDDPAKVKWSAFLSDDRYKDEVGIFEGGGGYYDRGVYRPSVNSMMNTEVEYFNAPSRWAIYQRIMKLSGEECSFEKFLEYDEINRKAVQN